MAEGTPSRSKMAQERSSRSSLLAENVVLKSALQHQRKRIKKLIGLVRAAQKKHG